MDVNRHFVWPLVARHEKKDKMDIKNGQKKWTSITISYGLWLPDIKKSVKWTLKMDSNNGRQKCTLKMYIKKVYQK
jgi:hypothetical protein